MRALVRGLFLGSLVVASFGCGSSDGNKGNLADASSDVASRDTASPDVSAPVDNRPGSSDVSGLDGSVAAVDSTPARDLGGTAVDTGVNDVAGKIDGGAADAPASDSPSTPSLDGASSEASRAVDSAALDGSKPDTAVVADTATASDTVSASSCDYPKCLQDLQSACVPSGACTMQLDLVTFSTSTCYANGVKFSTALGSSLNSAVTWKNSSGICYSVETSNASTAGADLTWKTAAGAVAATAREDFTARTITISCTGQSAVTISLDCGSDGGTTSDAGACAQGTCAF